MSERERRERERERRKKYSLSTEPHNITKKWLNLQFLEYN